MSLVSEVTIVFHVVCWCLLCFRSVPGMILSVRLVGLFFRISLGFGFWYVTFSAVLAFLLCYSRGLVVACWSSPTIDEVWCEGAVRCQSWITTQSWTAQLRKNSDHRTLTKVSYDDLTILPQLSVQQRGSYPWLFVASSPTKSKPCRKYTYTHMEQELQGNSDNERTTKGTHYKTVPPHKRKIK